MCRSDKVTEALGLTDEEYRKVAEEMREVLRGAVYGGNVNPTPLLGGIENVEKAMV